VNGGIGWQEVDFSEAAAANQDLLLSGPPACTRSVCYRVVRDRVEQGNWELEESTDTGHTWQESAMQRPLSQTTALATTDDAVVVAMGEEGVVSKQEGESWTFEGLGPISASDRPAPTMDPERADLYRQSTMAVAFYAVLIGTYGVAVASIPGLARIARLWIAGSTIGGIVYTSVVVWLAIREPPMAIIVDGGVLGWLVNGLVFLGVPAGFVISIGVLNWRQDRQYLVPRAVLAVAVAGVIGMGLVGLYTAAAILMQRDPLFSLVFVG
jgi:hypothetical protein